MNTLETVATSAQKVSKDSVELVSVKTIEVNSKLSMVLMVDPNTQENFIALDHFNFPNDYVVFGQKTFEDLIQKYNQK